MIDQPLLAAVTDRRLRDRQRDAVVSLRLEYRQCVRDQLGEAGVPARQLRERRNAPIGVECHFVDGPGCALADRREVDLPRRWLADVSDLGFFFHQFSPGLRPAKNSMRTPEPVFIATVNSTS